MKRPTLTLIVRRLAIAELRCDALGEDLLAEFGENDVHHRFGIKALGIASDIEPVFDRVVAPGEPSCDNPVGRMVGVGEELRPRFGKISAFRDLLENAQLDQKNLRVQIITNYDDLIALFGERFHIRTVTKPL